MTKERTNKEKSTKDLIWQHYSDHLRTAFLKLKVGIIFTIYQRLLSIISNPDLARGVQWWKGGQVSDTSLITLTGV